jgi:hypothetical protein
VGIQRPNRRRQHYPTSDNQGEGGTKAGQHSCAEVSRDFRVMQVLGDPCCLGKSFSTTRQPVPIRPRDTSLLLKTNTHYRRTFRNALTEQPPLNPPESFTGGQISPPQTGPPLGRGQRNSNMRASWPSRSATRYQTSLFIHPSHRTGDSSF